jgi:ferredoxin
MPARATVDHDRCEGNMLCEAAAPAVFKVNDDDLSEVLVDVIPAGELENVERAVRLCPKQAIAITED